MLVGVRAMMSSMKLFYQLFFLICIIFATLSYTKVKLEKLIICYEICGQKELVSCSKFEVYCK